MTEQFCKDCGQPIDPGAFIFYPAATEGMEGIKRCARCTALEILRRVRNLPAVPEWAAYLPSVIEKLYPVVTPEVD